jgi:hypothetical protein
MSETNENAPIDELSPAMKEEGSDVVNLMHKHVFDFVAPLIGKISADMMITSVTNPLGLIDQAIGTMTMGAFLYRRLLIESGVDVIALEQNFKDLNMD